MITFNELMKKRLDSVNSKARGLINDIVYNTREIYDCIIYDAGCEIDDTTIAYDKIMSMYGDRTGYEVACNEIRIEKDILSKDQIISFLIELDKELATKFSKKVVIYILELDDSLELRFHSFRENDKGWLVDRLDDYDIPILRYIS